MWSREAHKSTPFPWEETELWVGPGALGETCHPHLLPPHPPTPSTVARV